MLCFSCQISCGNGVQDNIVEQTLTLESLNGVNANASKTVNIIKVSARSRTAAVAGAIAGVMREDNHADVQAIGAGAVNLAVKAIVIAKGYLSEEGVNIVCVPSFVDIDIDDQERTAVRFAIEPRA